MNKNEPEHILARGYAPLKLSYYENGGRTPTIFKDDILSCIGITAQVGSLLHYIRVRLSQMNHTSLTANEGYYLMIRKQSVLPLPNIALKTLYDKYKEEDGFLHIVICKEDMFGHSLAQPMFGWVPA